MVDAIHRLGLGAALARGSFILDMIQARMHL
jgi:hypothetical protein